MRILLLRRKLLPVGLAAKDMSVQLDAGFFKKMEQRKREEAERRTRRLERQARVAAAALEANQNPATSSSSASPRFTPRLTPRTRHYTPRPLESPDDPGWQAEAELKDLSHVLRTGQFGERTTELERTLDAWMDTYANRPRPQAASAVKRKTDDPVFDGVAFSRCVSATCQITYADADAQALRRLVFGGHRPCSAQPAGGLLLSRDAFRQYCQPLIEYEALYGTILMRRDMASHRPFTQLALLLEACLTDDREPAEEAQIKAATAALQTDEHGEATIATSSWDRAAALKRGFTRATWVRYVYQQRGLEHVPPAPSALVCAVPKARSTSSSSSSAAVAAAWSNPVPLGNVDAFWESTASVSLKSTATDSSSPKPTLKATSFFKLLDFLKVDWLRKGAFEDVAACRDLLFPPPLCVCTAPQLLFTFCQDATVFLNFRRGLHSVSTSDLPLTRLHVEECTALVDAWLLETKRASPLIGFYDAQYPRGGCGGEEDQVVDMDPLVRIALVEDLVRRSPPETGLSLAAWIAALRNHRRSEIKNNHANKGL